MAVARSTAAGEDGKRRRRRRSCCCCWKRKERENNVPTQHDRFTPRVAAALQLPLTTTTITPPQNTQSASAMLLMPYVRSLFLFTHDEIVCILKKHWWSSRVPSRCCLCVSFMRISIFSISIYTIEIWQSFSSSQLSPPRSSLLLLYYYVSVNAINHRPQTLDVDRIFASRRESATGPCIIMFAPVSYK